MLTHLLAPVLLLALALLACDPLPAIVPSLAQAGITALSALAEERGLSGIADLDFALELLERGDIEGCCSVLRHWLNTNEHDPRVAAVLQLLEAQLERERTGG
jgi:hypothetical protein